MLGSGACRRSGLHLARLEGGHFDTPLLKVYEIEASSDVQEFNIFCVLSSDHQTTGTYAVLLELTASGASGEKRSPRTPQRASWDHSHRVTGRR